MVFLPGQVQPIPKLALLSYLGLSCANIVKTQRAERSSVTYNGFVHAVASLAEILLHVKDNVLLLWGMELDQAASVAFAVRLGSEVVLGTCHKLEARELVVLPVFEAPTSALPID